MPIACHNALSPLPKKVSKMTATVSIQNLPAGLNLRKTVVIFVTAYPEVSPMEGSMPHAQRVLSFLAGDSATRHVTCVSLQAAEQTYCPRIFRRVCTTEGSARVLVSPS